MEEKTDVLRSELLTMISTTYAGWNLWEQKLCEDIDAKRENLSLTRYSCDRSCGITRKHLFTILTAASLFILYFAIFVYHCVNDTHCAYEFEDHTVLAPLIWVCNYLGSKSMN